MHLDTLKLRYGIPLLLLSVFTAGAQAGFETIFDGQSLKGWDGDPRFWRVEDGAIVGETTTETPTQGNTFLTWQGGEIDDFELKIEFKIHSGNSGIQYRAFPLANKPWAVGGYQADISADHKWTGAAFGEKHKGILARRGEKVVLGPGKGDRKVVAQLGEKDELLGIINKDGWNDYHIIAQGKHAVHKINGIVTAEFSENAENRLTSGLLALQLHAGPPMKVRFRNIQLRKLNGDDMKKVLFLAGGKSHGYGAHEHKAGCMLLARCLNESGLDVRAQVVTDGAWPESWLEYDRPDTLVMYCDGYRRHMAKDHQDKIQALTDDGVGVVCLHFGVEVEPQELGPTFLDWIGGYFEIGWSVNPTWEATFDVLPDHPIANGVKPFTIRDEWYYHMRFQPEMKGVTPILSALPPLNTLTDRAHNKDRGSNPAVMAEVSAGKKQVLAWAYERPEGGRGFGFTGGHFHKGWQQDDFRKVVLNALVWTAHGTLPPDGVSSRTPSDADLELNQDFPKPEPKK